jgi:glycosyltransferase involved in cell wall biosynthesis
MREIVFVGTNEWVPWGGSEVCWSAAADRLARRNMEVRVSVKEWGAPVAEIEHLRSVGCRIFYRALPSSWPERIKRISFSRSYECRHLSSVGKNAALVVVAQGGHTDGLHWMEAARCLGLKYAVISQSVSEQWWPSDELAGKMAECFEAASAAFFVSDANLELSRRQFVTPLGRGRVIRNPFNVHYDTRPAWPDNPVCSLSFGCVARLDPAQKSQDLIMQVLDRSHWRGRDVRVTLAGSGVCEQSLRKKASEMNLPNLEFAGFVDDIERFWTRHHALLLPSRFEGMPLALVEAMLCGRPCVVTDVGGNPELIRDGVNGFLAKAPTVELLDVAMNRAWEDRRKLREMGEVAARDVRQWVGPDPTGDFVRELEELVGR